MAMFRIDGVKMKIVASDIDGDGVVGGTEIVQSHKETGVTPVYEKTELGEALELQNKDVENDQKLSSVDFISRINSYQHAPLVAVDVIASMGVISRKSRLIVKNIMRKAVSLEGKGRKEFVELVTGHKELEIKKGASNFVGENQVRK